MDRQRDRAHRLDVRHVLRCGAETPIGRAFGKTKLGEWLDARIKSYKAGEAPILGPKQALRKLLELRRRGERGEEGEKPPKTGDAYDKLAEKHGLDDVVTQILREQQIDPALVERLLAKKMDPFDIAETALDFGERRRTAGLGADAGCVPRGRARRRVVLADHQTTRCFAGTIIDEALQRNALAARRKKRCFAVAGCRRAGGRQRAAALDRVRQDEAPRQTLEVPALLRPYLLTLAKGRPVDAQLISRTLKPKRLSPLSSR